MKSGTLAKNARSAAKPETSDVGLRYEVQDLATGAKDSTDDFLEVIRIVDAIRYLGHDALMRNSSTGQEFNWRAKSK